MSYSLSLCLVTIMLFVSLGKRSNSCLQMFYKMVALKNPAKFTVKHLCWSFFLINVIKKRLKRGCFPVNIAKSLSTDFYVDTSCSLYFSEILREDRILCTTLGTKLIFYIFLVPLLCFLS